MSTLLRASCPQQGLVISKQGTGVFVRECARSKRYGIDRYVRSRWKQDGTAMHDAEAGLTEEDPGPGGGFAQLDEAGDPLAEISEEWNAVMLAVIAATVHELSFFDSPLTPDSRKGKPDACDRHPRRCPQ